MKWLFAWILSLAFFGGFLGFAKSGEKINRNIASSGEAVLIIGKGVGTGIGVSLILALVLYLLLSHRVATRFAASLEVSVEGAFLRIRQHAIVLTDRKVHFRSIVDYATTQDFLMRYFGIHSLRMTTSAGGPDATITILGVKDCLKIRDMLSDIDRLREHQ